jgi:hypothetical protein
MPPECANKAFSAQLKTNTPGKSFELLVSAVPPVPPGNSRGMITIKTSSTNTPVLNVTAMVYQPQPRLLVMPPRINLAPFSGRAVTQKVVIQTTGPENLELREPTVNAEGVAVEIKTLKAGTSYELDVEFPADFQPPAGQPLELTVKSNQRQRPLIHVPIIQSAALMRQPAAPKKN